VIIERRDGDWTVMWWSAHYLGDTSTNNQAEHEALRRGVTECGRRYSQRCAHITIIGDSQLILRQVDGTNQTTNTNLASRGAAHPARPTATRLV
jgi:ribonuclease HI